VGRAAVAQALTAFYPPADGYAPYRVAVDGDPICTSIVTRPDWLGLNLTLGVGNDRSTVTGPTATARQLDQLGAEAATDRIADSLVSSGRMVDAALYSLHNIETTADAMSTEFAVTDFLSYALTLNLLENELIDALAAGRAPTSETLPLRTRYLPDLPSVTQVDQRLCAGGVVALFAAARPANRRRPGQGDYVFLVQQRSNRTLNANQKLAVIPKAFHQPLVDHTDDAQLSATLEREMEEELFGREDLDDASSQRRADPLHLSRFSAPMRWLVDHTDPGVWRIECTGFGLNLVSGNYEFASLVVIDDDSWWEQFGGSIEANWETEGLRRYSTLDRAGIARLVQDDTWSNEALFALLQGLRRLTKIGGPRVDLPPTTLEM
jgi:hypothetical protein